MNTEIINQNFSSKKVVFFDLGGTLVKYYNRKEFPEILEKSIGNVLEFLEDKYEYKSEITDIWKKVEKENYENENHQVRPLEVRLKKIFGLDEFEEGSSLNNLYQISCRLFLIPIFDIGRLFDDTIPCLSKIKDRGYKIGLISNTPWGSPSVLWRDELKRHDLDKFFDKTVFCRDVGWRKPAKQIFYYASEIMRVNPEECLFIGDDPRWDLIGPNNVGMDALIIDRTEEKRVYDKGNIISLYQLFELL